MLQGMTEADPRRGVKDFDVIGDAFEFDIYGRTKGAIRFEVLWNDLLEGIPALRGGGQRILDVGGGAGRLAIRAAELGNQVTLCDPSARMVELAQRAIADAESPDVQIHQLGAQELADLGLEPFDVVACHAVLEWIDEPQDAVAAVVRCLAPSGRLSLMFYNESADIVKRVLSARPRSAWGEGARALSEVQVRRWLDDVGIAVRSKAGIRIFHDHMSDERLTELGLQGLLAIEMQYRTIEPFASLGQHIHLIGELQRDG